MSMKKKTLKEKAAYFAELERETRDTIPEDFIGWGNDTIKRAFLKDYEETKDFIPTAEKDELECFISVLSDFVKKYPNEEIIDLCVERQKQVGEFPEIFFDEEIKYARKIVSKRK